MYKVFKLLMCLVWVIYSMPEQFTMLYLYFLIYILYEAPNMK